MSNWNGKLVTDELVETFISTHLNSAADEQIDHIGPQRVTVLVEETVCVVPNLEKNSNKSKRTV